MQPQPAQAVVVPIRSAGGEKVARELRRSFRNTGVTTIGAAGLVAATAVVCVAALSPSIPNSHPREAPSAKTTQDEPAAIEPAPSAPIQNSPVAAPVIPTFPGVPLADRAPLKEAAGGIALEPNLPRSNAPVSIPTPSPAPTPIAETRPTPDRSEACGGSTEGHSPVLNLPLSDVSGSTAVVAAEGSTAAAYAGLMETTLTGPMPCSSVPGGAYHLDGASSFAHTSEVMPALHTFTIAIWFRTSTPGGKLIGYGDAATGASSSYDRHLYLTDDGELVFGVFPSKVKTIQSPASYTDGNWHHAVATLSGSGMRLYVDGSEVAADPSVTRAQADYLGYWRIGYDNLDKWGPTTPGNHHFAGDLRYAQVYPEDLGAADIARLYHATLAT
ncbi:LamG domain-containing protein [Diaminobutyricibacter tongyongensis]|nr:LamG domain-containing protein [Diaminobutyricibacter tongyongensis]